MALIGAAQLATAEHMLGSERPVGIGTECYTGRALVVDDPTVAMATFEPGDVIITAATSPSWNTMLVHAGALVTANGGLVSHAAVTARELGIPADHRRPHGVPAVAHRLHRHRRPGPGHRRRQRVSAASAVMPPFPSAPAFVVLHTVRIGGRVPTATLPGLTGLTMDAIDDELSAAADAGWLCHHEGVVSGWSLTPAGRQRHLALLTHERAAAGRDAEIVAGYDDLMGLNGWFKSLCTEWQLHDHPASCIDRLVAEHPQVDAITGRLAGALTRFSPYTARFARALERLQAGDLDAFTMPLRDSYHDVWMQLHEDLLLTLGRDRSGTDGS